MKKNLKDHLADLERAECRREENDDPFEIDPHALDVELIRQPKLYGDAARAVADARADLERAECRRDVVKAEVSLSIRACPSDHGLEKVTEDTVKCAAVVNKQCQHAEMEVIKAKHTLDIMVAAEKQVSHRKTSLEKLVELFLADYFSAPKLPKGEEARDQARGMRAGASFRPMRDRGDS